MKAKLLRNPLIFPSSSANFSSVDGEASAKPYFKFYRESCGCHKQRVGIPPVAQPKSATRSEILPRQLTLPLIRIISPPLLFLIRSSSPRNGISKKGEKRWDTWMQSERETTAFAITKKRFLQRKIRWRRRRREEKKKKMQIISDTATTLRGEGRRFVFYDYFAFLSTLLARWAGANEPTRARKKSASGSSLVVIWYFSVLFTPPRPSMAVCIHLWWCRSPRFSPVARSFVIILRWHRNH